MNSGAAADRAFCSPAAVTQQSAPESRGGYRPGLKIPTGAWRRIQLQLKDKSICERAASGNLGPSRSEESFASRQALAKVPRSSHQAAPDTVEKCFKERLVRLGLPVDILQNSLKRLNHFVVEKLADIEKLARKCIN
ncbi:hypothetical protein MTO96_033211 [Rhipicephalus appendiculatus]